ncbi:endonuclease MutS2 [bacterium]|nr:endonuclease MutS2 [bacterium]
MYSFNKLEFNKLKDLIKTHCQSYLGKDKVDELHPLADIAQINEQVEMIDTYQSMIKEGLTVRIEDLSNLDYFFSEFKGFIMGIEEFQLVITNIRIGNDLKRKLASFEGYKKVKGYFAELEAYPEITERYDRIFSPEGEVLDTASAELNRIRKSKKDTRSSIQRTLNSKLQDPQFEKYLQEKIITTRGDRFVVPIKEGKVKFVGGVVQERSSSGASVFVEPPEIVEMNNKISFLKQAEKEEIYKIFKKFTEMILPLQDSLIKNTELIGQFDFFYASAAFSNYLKANRVRIVSEAIISLKEARHPLLIHTLRSIEKVIPFQLEIGENYNILILSGPNTGGKTVTLKGTGLLTMMALSGLPIPADKESKIGIFEHIFADIGDEQSLETSLSTFSSHIGQIKKMIDNANAKTLILIDEIGSSTDPEQGSALAQAVLEEVEKLSAKGIITTHFTALKVFAEKNENCRNASMQFDSREHKPTYRFVFGLPGDSFAIDVAEGLGLNEEIIKRSKELAGTQNVELTNLIKRLEVEKKKLGQVTYKHELQVALLKGKEEEYKKKILQLEAEAKEIKKKQLKQAQQYLIDMQKELHQDMDDIKKLDKEERKTKSQKILKKLSLKHQEINAESQKLSARKGGKINQPEVGMRVWVESFETEANIMEISKSTVIVDMDGITFKTSLDNIITLPEHRQKAEKKQEAVSLVSTDHAPKASFELKVLGLTFDEAKILIDEFLDNANLAGLKKLRIVHGKGTGALRIKVRQHLQRIRIVKSFHTPPENAGGSGVTIVELH